MDPREYPLRSAPFEVSAVRVQNGSPHRLAETALFFLFRFSIFAKLAKEVPDEPRGRRRAARFAAPPSLHQYTTIENNDHY